jgi:NADP-reducing hydrogenase subunit HndB
MEQLLELRQKAEQRLQKEKLSSKIRITVGSATCENAAGATEIYKQVEALIAQHKLKDVTLSRVGCSGRCDMEPVVVVFAKGAAPVKYSSMNADKVTTMFESHILKAAPVKALAMPHKTPVWPIGSRQYSAMWISSASRCA